MKIIIISVVSSFVGNYAFADLFHYNNIIVGDRAVGLGGAYTAVSDDSSGVIYNPAGLAFAQSNDISGSANAYYRRRVVYKKIIGDDDFVEQSEGMVASFFGGIQKLDKVVPRLAAGFAVYSPDSEIKEQNDLISKPELGVTSFHRAVKLNASTLKVGLAAAYRPSGWLSIGLGANFVNISELMQDYQLSVSKIPKRTTGYYLYSPYGGSSQYKIKDTVAAAAGHESLYQVNGSDSNSKLTGRAIEPVLGMQCSLGRFVLGASVRKGILFTDTLERFVDGTKFYRFDNHDVVTKQDLDTGTGLGDPSTYQDSLVYGPHNIGTQTAGVKINLQNAISDLPVSIRTGAAWFASSSFLWTFDVEHHTAVTSDLVEYNRNSVTNFASGIEYYLSPSVPLRTGFFTNYDARYKDKIGSWALETIDYYGGSLYLSWAETSSQFGGGAVVQYGTGSAKKLGQSANSQKVEALSTTFSFSATHQL